MSKLEFSYGDEKFILRRSRGTSGAISSAAGEAAAVAGTGACRQAGLSAVPIRMGGPPMGRADGRALGSTTTHPAGRCWTPRDTA